MGFLNRTTGTQVLRFFDTCFKRGVIDAYELGDDMEAQSFLDARVEDWKFGVLGKPSDYDWRSFRVTAYWWARKAGLSSLAEDYIFKAHVKSQIGCFLLFSMRFYLKGIAEWLAYPNPVGIEVFKTATKAHWDTKGQPKCFTKPDYISYMHEMEHEFSRVPEERRETSLTSMGGFISAVYDLTRKYAGR